EMKQLDSGLEKSKLGQDTILYRGAGSYKRFHVLEAGSEITDHGYGSTSAFKDSSFTKEVALRITAKKGAVAAPIPSHHDNEKEFLLPRSTTYRVKSVEYAKPGSGEVRMIAHVEVG